MLALVCAATLSISPVAFAQDGSSARSGQANSGDYVPAPVTPAKGTSTQNITGAADPKAAADAEPESCVGSTFEQSYALGRDGTAHAGGPATGDVAPDQVTSGTNSDGRAEVYALAKSDHTLWKRYELAANGGWSGWVQAGPAMACRIAVGYNDDGRVELFGIRADTREIWHSWQTAPNGPFSGWSPFSGPAADVTVGQNADGRMEIFARNPVSLEVYNIFQVAPSSGWSAWGKFSGPAAGVAIGTNDDGRMEVFAQNPQTLEIYDNYQLRPSGPWAGWRKFSGPALDMKVGTDFEGRQHLFARSPGTTNLYHVQQTGPNGRWGAWAQFGGPTVGVTVGLQAFGMAVYAVNPDNRIVYETFQDGDVFSAWYPRTDQPVASPVTPATSFDDQGYWWSHLFAVTTGGKVVKTSLVEYAPNTWDWYSPWSDFSY